MPDPRETLARIRAQADAATPGPWRAAVVATYVDADWQRRGKGGIYPGGKQGPPPLFLTMDWLETDAAFIAAARTDVPWLLEQVETRDKALDAVLELHKPIQASMTSNGGVIEVTVCAHCLDPTWPCQTRAAITTALEEDHA